MYCYNCMNEISSNGVCSHCGGKHESIYAPHRLKPGVMLRNRYLVGNVLGEGGFGITYIGRDTTLDVRVAIKEFFPSGYVNRNTESSSEISVYTDKQKEFVTKGKERFLQEARSIAKFLDEPGVVDVRDFFEENSTAYIIMEFLDGESLSEHIKTRGVMKAEHIFKIMMPIMRSLDKMHQSGIIHRDISPDNIMYLTDGRLKLMDFGSARYFTNGEKEMSVMVKRGYAPEEQYRKNGNQGPWTDVYGMCATIYRCVTGKVPDDSPDRSFEDNLQKPSELGVAIPPALERVLMYGIAVYEQDRCKNMSELLGLVQDALSNRTVNIDIDSVEFHDENKTCYADDAQDNVYNKGYIADKAPKDYDTLHSFVSHDAEQESEPEPQKKRTRTLIPLVIVLSAIAVICIAVALFFALPVLMERDKDNPKSESNNPSYQLQQQDETKARTGNRVPDRYFSMVTASSTLRLSDGGSYDAVNVLYDDETYWAEGADNEGVGEWITLESTEERGINGLMIVNGCAATEEQYVNSGKVNKLLLEFSDGTHILATVNTLSESNRKCIQYIDFGGGEFARTIYTDSIKVKIEEATEGAKNADTCITYLVPYTYE